MATKPRKFRLVDNDSPIFTDIDIGTRGIEIPNFPLLKIWNTKEAIKNFKFVAVLFEGGEIQMLSEIQLEELPEDTVLTFPNQDEDFFIESEYIN